MIEICSPRDEAELAVMKAVLDGEGIRYFVRNDHFGTLMVGPRIEGYNAKAVLVDESDRDRARELLAEFLRPKEDDPADENESHAQPTYSFADKVRMVLEVLFLGWIMPGRRRKRS
ncbi:DUF2007 domain-containing protein [Candidatus Sumerlaeota bacterium]|nr:DUF2007 domain-containing protein [Candidatus Sumerlaeota bacterium]